MLFLDFELLNKLVERNRKKKSIFNFRFMFMVVLILENHHQHLRLVHLHIILHHYPLLSLFKQISKQNIIAKSFKFCILKNFEKRNNMTRYGQKKCSVVHLNDKQEYGKSVKEESIHLIWISIWKKKCGYKFFFFFFSLMLQTKIKNQFIKDKFIDYPIQNRE